jgi:mercuric ion transport protein
MDQNTKLLGTGLAGALISLLCCFTPVLAIALSALGFAAYVAKLDYVLIAVFLVSIALVVIGFVRRKRFSAGTPQ